MHAIVAHAIIAFIEKTLLSYEPQIQAFILDELKLLMDKISGFLAEKVGTKENG